MYRAVLSSEVPGTISCVTANRQRFVQAARWQVKTPMSDELNHRPDPMKEAL